MESLNKSLSKNTGLHLVVENEVNKTPFGQITFTCTVIDGVVQLDTLNVVKNKRRRYQGLTKESKE